AANDFLCQFQADMLGVEVHRPAVTETTGLGAAYLAGVGVGLWKPADLAARGGARARLGGARRMIPQRRPRMIRMTMGCLLVLLALLAPAGPAAAQAP